MIQTAEKNRKRQSTYLPNRIGLILKIAVAIAGFGFAFLLRASVIQTSLMTLSLASVALWGWSFVAVVAGIYLLWNIIKGVFYFLFSIAIIITSILLIVALITIII